MKTNLKLGLGIVASAALLACGAESGAGVTLESGSYSQALGAEQPASEFEFCITQLKLEGEAAPDSVDGGTDEEEQETRLGLVSLGDGSRDVVWGSLDHAVGSTIERIKVEIHHDEELCGTDFSMVYGDQTLTKDIEMSFAFETPVTVPEDGTVTLDLSPIVRAYHQAFTEGKLNNEEIGDFIEGVEGEADAD